VLWCEARGLGEQLEKLCRPFSGPVFSSGGFDSVTIKPGIAETFAEMGDVRVLHIGDHDPSCVHVFGSLDEDVTAFIDELGGDVQFLRLAVLPEHVMEFNLATAPPKKTDNRNFQGETVQVEALAPSELAGIVQTALEEYVDPEELHMARQVEAEDKAWLTAWVDRAMLEVE